MTSSKLQDMQVKELRTAYCKVEVDLTTFCLLVVTGEIKGFKQTEFTPRMADAGQ